jgi:hypothetical protein
MSEMIAFLNQHEGVILVVSFVVCWLVLLALILSAFEVE